MAATNNEGYRPCFMLPTMRRCLMLLSLLFYGNDRTICQAFLPHYHPKQHPHHKLHPATRSRSTTTTNQQPTNQILSLDAASQRITTATNTPTSSTNNTQSYQQKRKNEPQSSTYDGGATRNRQRRSDGPLDSSMKSLSQSTQDTRQQGPPTIRENDLRIEEQQVLALMQSIIVLNNNPNEDDVSLRTSPPPTSSDDSETWKMQSSALNCLAKWAKLGNGTEAMRLLHQLLSFAYSSAEPRQDMPTAASSSSSSSQVPSTHIQLQQLLLQDDANIDTNGKKQREELLPIVWRLQAARFVLQAWCQEIRNQTPPTFSSSSSSSPGYYRSMRKDENDTRSTILALEHAETILKWMEHLDEQVQSQPRLVVKYPLPHVPLQAQDYHAIIQAALQLGQVSLATDVFLTRWLTKITRGSVNHNKETTTTIAPPKRPDVIRLIRAWSNLLHQDTKSSPNINSKYNSDQSTSRKETATSHVNEEEEQQQNHSATTTLPTGDKAAIVTPLMIASQVTRIGQAYLTIQHRNNTDGNSKDSGMELVDDLDLYNIMLDAWSKVLPKVVPLTLSPSSPTLLQEPSTARDATQMQLLQQVEQQATNLWQQVQGLELPRDHGGEQIKFLKAKSYTLMIYIYCKCQQLEQAWKTWKDLVSYLLQGSQRSQVVADHKGTSPSSTNTQRRNDRRFGDNRVDSRSFRALVQCFVRYIHELEMQKSAVVTVSVDLTDIQAQQTTWAERASSVLEDMWKLDGADYADVAPDVYMYTTVITAWAWASESNTNKENTGATLHSAQRLLLELEDRYHKETSLERQRKLQPDVALYNAVLQAMIVSSTNSPDLTIEAAGSFVNQMQLKSRDNPRVAPDTITYNILLEACVKHSDKSDDINISLSGLHRAEQTLSWMIQECQNGNKRVKPNYRSFFIVIQGLLEASETGKAEEWLDRMEERYTPSPKLFYSLIEICCRKDDGSLLESNEAGLAMKDKMQLKQELFRAQRILIRMEELYRETGTTNLLPDQSLYDMVLQAWKDMGDDIAAAEQLESLRRSQDRLNILLPIMNNPVGSVEQLQSSDAPFDLPEHVVEIHHNLEDRELTTLGFNKVLKQVTDSSTDDMSLRGQRAEDILDHMIQLHLSGGSKGMQINPDIISFNTVISAWAKTEHPQSAKRAEAVLQKLIKLQASGCLLDVKPDRITFNSIIHAYAKLGASVDADRVFRALESMHQTASDERYQPDVVTYSTVLNAWANSNRQGAANHAEQVLLRMHEAHKANPSSYPAPNTECFNEVLYAWARSTDVNAAKRAEMVMRLMEDMSNASGNDIVKPSTRSYNIVLYALARSDDSDIDAPFRAQMLLEKMKKAARSGENWMRPDHVTYTTVISAWCRLGGRQALDATERLVKEACESRYGIVVDDDFFANVIYSLSRSGEKGAAQKAESIVSRMKLRPASNKQFNVAPTTKVYNALLHCWAKSGDRDAASRAESILESMQESAKPNVQSFTSVLDALARSRDADAWKRAESLVASMELMGRDDVSLRPNAHTYTSLIHNYARSRDLPQKAVKAQSVLERMKESFEKEGNIGARPNIIGYNAVLNACEYVPLATTNSDDWQEAFRVACMTWNEIRGSSYLTPNHVTYAGFLGVIAKLMPRSEIRNNMSELIFKRCCSDGQVAGIVMTKLKAASPLHYNKVISSLRKDGLPREWSYNVKEK